MSRIERGIDVQVPVSTAYNQWTQFEDFPCFMEGVQRVEQLSDTKLHWVAEIAGTVKEWDATITEQLPDQRIAWTSTEGASNGGVVTFHHLSDDITRVMLQLDYEPEGVLETVGSALGVAERRVAGDLSRFKEFIEQRGHETGSWRGVVKRDDKQAGKQDAREYHDPSLGLNALSTDPNARRERMTLDRGMEATDHGTAARSMHTGASDRAILGSGPATHNPDVTIEPQR